MKLTKNPASGRVYARLKTGNPAKPYVRFTLGTASLEEARRKAKEANLEKIEAALQAGQLSQQAIARLTVGKKLTVEAAAEQWLASRPALDESPATTAKSRAVLSQWFALQPEVKTLPPLGITEAHVSAFVNRPDPEVSESTRLRQLSVLRRFFAWCVEHGLCPGNVAGKERCAVQHRALSQTQREPTKVQPFTEEEIQHILAHSEGFFRWATGIAAATAMRLGDICQLEHASFAVPGHIVVHLDKSIRRICLPINERVTPGLAAILAEIPPVDSQYLFPEEKRQYDDITNGRPKFSTYFGRLLDSLDIDRTGGRKSFHSLRHSAITRWARIGFDPSLCAEYAGHGSATVTAGYIHS